MAVNLSDDVKLTHRGLFCSAVLIEPFPIGCGGQDGTVLGVPPVGLVGDLSLPVLEAYAGACLVHPVSVHYHVIDTQPDLLLRPDALANVAVKLVILVCCQRGAQAASLGDAVIVGCVEGLFYWIGQETLSQDLCAFQANWEANYKELMTQMLILSANQDTWPHMLEDCI